MKRVGEIPGRSGSSLSTFLSPNPPHPSQADFSPAQPTPAKPPNQKAGQNQYHSWGGCTTFSLWGLGMFTAAIWFLTHGQDEKTSVAVSEGSRGSPASSPQCRRGASGSNVLQQTPGSRLGPPVPFLTFLGDPCGKKKKKKKNKVSEGKSPWGGYPCGKNEKKKKVSREAQRKTTTWSPHDPNQKLAHDQPFISGNDQSLLIRVRRRL